MNRKIQKLIGDAKGKMNGYVALLKLRYGNLCVKADVISLLPVTIVIGNEEFNIEDVAEAGILKEDVLAVIPKDSDDLFDIGKGIMKAHPEFKMDIVQNERSDDEKDKYLTFTMPEVNKDRHDLLETGVKGLHEQCKARIDAVLEIYTVRITKELKGAAPAEIDDAKDKLKEIYDFYNETMESLTKEKLQEIDEAYERYQAQQEQKEQEKREEEQAHGTNKGQSMTFDQ